MYCVKCEIVISSGKFCGVCGNELIEAIATCPHSTEVFPHKCHVWDRFCNICGKPVQEEMNALVKQALININLGGK